MVRTNMGNSEFIDYCKRLVVDYVNRSGHTIKGGHKPYIKEMHVFVVWICKTLQNNKALLSTTIDSDPRYYEITYNGDKEEFYFDVYDKLLNKCITREMLTNMEEWEW